VSKKAQIIHLKFKWTVKYDKEAHVKVMKMTDFELDLQVLRTIHASDWVEEHVMKENWSRVDYMQSLI